MTNEYPLDVIAGILRGSDGPIDPGLPPPMPNLEALDEELTERIRRLVHQELAPLIEAEVDRQFQERFSWLKEPPRRYPLHFE